MENTTVNLLLNPLILSRVYKKLDFRNKKSFRLVCKPWIDAILGKWRKQTKLVIRDDPEFSNLMELFNRPVQPGFYHTLEYPITHLDLRTIGFATLLNKSNLETAQTFIVKHFGHSLEHLEVAGSQFPPGGRLGHGLKRILLKDFPKLNSLTIIRPKFILNEDSALEEAFNKTVAENLTTLNLVMDGNFLPIGTKTCEDILSMVPNLQKLRLTGEACSILESLKLPLASTGRHILLESLFINDILSLKYCEKIPNWLTNYFEAAQPPLQTLKLVIPAEVAAQVEDEDAEEILVQPFSLRGILTNVAATLTCLDLRVRSRYGIWCRALYGCSLPKLNKLAVRFQDLSGDMHDLIKFDFEMLRGTPALKLLHLYFEITGSNAYKVGTKVDEGELEWRGEEGMERREPIRLENLEDFRFELYHKPSENCWREIASIMPNLRKLGAIMDQQTYELVLQIWPELTHCFWNWGCGGELRLRRKYIFKRRSERGKTVLIEVRDFRDVDDERDK